MTTVTIDEQTSKSIQKLANQLQKTPGEVIELLVREKLQKDDNREPGNQSRNELAQPGQDEPTPEELVKRWMELTNGLGKLWKEPWKSTPHGDLLYDELGLPK
jgi:hypothetical protein